MAGLRDIAGHRAAHPAKSGEPDVLLEQGLPGAPDDSADRLAACGLGIDDLSGVVGAGEAVQAHQLEIGINPYLGEDR
jgi:hypothetical protein